MDYPQSVKPIEKVYINVHAFRTCKAKTMKKNFGTDKVGEDERIKF